MTERPDPLAPPEGYGEKFAPGWSGGRVQDPDTDLAGPRTDEFCCHGRDEPSSPPVCDYRYEYLFWLGDVSEHIMRIELCPKHAWRFADQLALGVRCRCTVCEQQMKVEKFQHIEADGSVTELPVPDPASPAQSALDRVFRD